MPMLDNEKMNRERLRADILSALSQVYEKDRDLLADNIDACERSLMHRFTRYFMELVESRDDSLYEGLRVDGEYNRHLCNPKRLNGKLIFPDVIVHRRNTDERNLCIIEFKKSLKDGGTIESSYKSKEKRFKADIRKLKAMTKHDGEYGYQWGAHVIFHAANEDDRFTGVEMAWFYDGRQCDNERIALPLVKI